MNDLVTTFKPPSEQVHTVNTAPLTETALLEVLKDPKNLMTHEIARLMAEENRAPYCHSARMTPNRQGYAVASYIEGEKLSIFIKPDTERLGTFWEFDLKKGFIPDPTVDTYLRENYDLYLAAFQSVIHMQSNDAGNLGWAATHYADYYRKLTSATLSADSMRLEAR